MRVMETNLPKAVLRIVRAMCLVVLAFTASSRPAFAGQPPVREPAPAFDATGQFCEDFPVLVHVLANRQFITIFSDGGVHITGQLKAEITNLDTGKTIVENISGPLIIEPDGTFFALGRGLLFGEAGFFGPGSPAELSINSGRVVINGFDLSILSRTGRTEDLCAELAEQ
jgi:hypothetical protein